MGRDTLRGKRGLVVGIANDRSIAYGCAKAFAEKGAELAVTYLNEKAEPYVRPLAEGMNASLILPCDVTKADELESVFTAIGKEWGSFDFLVHSIAYARKEDLCGRVVDCSEAGFTSAMAVSCHSFLRMARLSEPLMGKGGSLLTMTYHGSRKAVPGYGIMGPVKAALESCVRYMAAELGPKGIRVNGISAGVIKTRAASGVPNFDALFDEMVSRSFTGKPVGIEEVGALASLLVGDAAPSMSGSIYYIDGGCHSAS